MEPSSAERQAGEAREPTGAVASALVEEIRDRIEASRRSLAALLEARGARDLQNTLAPYDEIQIHLDAAGSLSALYERVHPDPEVRDFAERLTQEIVQFATELSLNRDVYEALQALDTGSMDAPTRYYVEHTLRDFRRAGVDKEAPARQRIRELNDELTLIGQEFARHMQTDRRVVYVSRADLDGLPADYIEAHAPGPDDHIAISTDYPDYVPFMSYSRSGKAREALYRAFRSRGYPANQQVLDRLLSRRHELAHLLGYRNFADYITEDKMIGSEQAAADFIERIARISRKRAEEDYGMLLQRKRADEPNATEVFDWEKDYYEQRVKAEEFSFDSQTVRPYFAFERVKGGLLDVTSRLFGVEYRRVENPAAWAPGVETYDVYEGGGRLGRFHLDLHPRADKYKHAAEFTVLNGVRDRQLPEAALVCNFAGGEPGDPGLMEHDDVETFFHEFGHLLHTLFAGRQPWMGIAGISTEWDFVEAPSQMLEEWARDPRVLQSFALHYQTDEPIPLELIERLRRSSEFGKGTYVRQQMYYAVLSLSLYNRDPAGIDTRQMVRELQNEYSAFRYVEGTHFHLSFGHLDGYSAIYYTYMWSLVIAKDLFSRFSPHDLLEPTVARRYRDLVLAPGGSAPAAQLVESFLGRPYGFEAYEAWLNAR